MAAEVIAGRYVLCDPIGAGGSGTVWRAFDRIRGQYCAAKLLRQRDAGELLRFAREQSVRLHHPNIVSPYAWAADDGMVLIASELIDGGSLQVLVGDYGALAEETVVEILDQVLSALEAVHTAELVHRDVKPGNVLLRATGTGPLRVMLTDFGLTISQRDARLTAAGMVIGTPGYLPPEVLLGGVSPEPAHDLYAVGKLALTLLTGHEVPAADHGAISVSDAILREVLHALLFADPARRPESAAAARASLLRARRSTVPLTCEGDPVAVLDQLPALPDGWDGGRRDARHGGSAGARARSQPRRSSNTTARARRRRRPPSLSERVTRPSRRRHRAGGDPDAHSSVSSSGCCWSRQPSSPRLLLQTNGSGGDTDTTTPVSTSPASAPPPTAAADLRAGDACGWQLEGDRRVTDDGELICAVDGGAYRWIVAPG